MRDEQEPRTDHPAEGVNLPLPGVKTAHDMEDASEHLLSPDALLESNELHAGGKTCARCGRTKSNAAAVPIKAWKMPLR